METVEGAKFYGRVLTVDYAFPKIKGREHGWDAIPSLRGSRKNKKYNSSKQIISSYGSR